MQLDYISKMSKGKRIPKEEERLTRLLDVSIFYLSCRNGFYYVLNCPDHDRNRCLLFTWKIS